MSGMPFKEIPKTLRLPGQIRGIDYIGRLPTDRLRRLPSQLEAATQGNLFGGKGRSRRQPRLPGEESEGNPQLAQKYKVVRQDIIAAVNSEGLKDIRAEQEIDRRFREAIGVGNFQDDDTPPGFDWNGVNAPSQNIK